jgi:hypothetical protein
MVQKSGVGFIETMDSLPVSKLPEGPEWTYELKLDGYRLEAVRGEKEVTLYSRRQKVLNGRFSSIAKALEHLPAGTVVDGEIVALGPNGHADFYLLQKFRSATSQIIYYVFDILVHENRGLIRLPLSERRRILGEVIKTETACCVVSGVCSQRSGDAEVCEDTRSRRANSQARRQRLPARKENGPLEKISHQPWTGSSWSAAIFPATSGLIRWLWAFIAAKSLSMRRASAPVSFPGPHAKYSRRSDT